jgi:hypothetical protein
MKGRGNVRTRRYPEIGRAIGVHVPRGFMRHARQEACFFFFFFFFFFGGVCEFFLTDLVFCPHLTPACRLYRVLYQRPGARMPACSIISQTDDKHGNVSAQPCAVGKQNPRRPGDVHKIPGLDRTGSRHQTVDRPMWRPWNWKHWMNPRTAI